MVSQEVLHSVHHELEENNIRLQENPNPNPNANPNPNTNTNHNYSR